MNFGNNISPIRMHLHCTHTPLSLIVDAPLNKNYVLDAKIVKELKHNFFKNAETPEEVLQELYEKQEFECLYHVCDSCQINTKIQKIKNHTKHQVIFCFNNKIISFLQKSLNISYAHYFPSLTLPF